MITSKKITTIRVILAIILSLFILNLAQYISGVISLTLQLRGLYYPVVGIVISILYLLLAFYGIRFLCNIVLKIPLSECRISSFKVKPIWVIVAFSMPIIISAVLLTNPGNWEKGSIYTTDIWATMIGIILYYGVAKALVDEVIYRGILMSAIEERWNKAAAIIIPSVIFGIRTYHLFYVPELDFLSIAQVVIAGTLFGILFSLVTYESGSIWNSFIIHAIWNIIMGDVYNNASIFNIDADSFRNSILTYTLETESFLITGGEFGVKSSIVSILVFLSFSVLAIFLIRRKKNN